MYVTIDFRLTNSFWTYFWSPNCQWKCLHKTHIVHDTLPVPLLFPWRETRPSSFGHTRTNIIYFFRRSFLSFSYYCYYFRRIQFYPTVCIERVLSFVSPSHWPYTGARQCGVRACRNLLYYLKVPNKINIRLPLIARP